MSMEETFDEMLKAQCEQLKNEKKNTEEVKESQEEAKKTLNGFLGYIRSKNFDMRAKTIAKENGIKDYKIVKNVFIKSFLTKVANVFGLTINITGEIVKYAFNFVSYIITKLVNFSQEICLKIINLVTLNCANV